jgi:hypothetical protein
MNEKAQKVLILLMESNSGRVATDDVKERRRLLHLGIFSCALRQQ